MAIAKFLKLATLSLRSLTRNENEREVSFVCRGDEFFFRPFFRKVKKNVVMRCWMLFNAWKFMQNVSYARNRFEKKKNANFVVRGWSINLFAGF